MGNDSQKHFKMYVYIRRLRRCRYVSPEKPIGYRCEPSPEKRANASPRSIRSAECSYKILATHFGSSSNHQKLVPVESSRSRYARANFLLEERRPATDPVYGADDALAVNTRCVSVQRSEKRVCTSAHLHI